MGDFKDKLADEMIRPKVITDCSRLVDSEVAAKRGVTGVMIKGGYKAFKAIKPRIVEEALNLLLDDFAAVIDRHLDEYRAAEPDGKVSFEAWAGRRDQRIANDLLGVTDAMMNLSRKAALKKIYKSLRGVAQKNVAVAVPAVARVVTKYTS